MANWQMKNNKKRQTGNVKWQAANGNQQKKTQTANGKLANWQTANDTTKNNKKTTNDKKLSMNMKRTPKNLTKLVIVR